MALAPPGAISSSAIVPVIRPGKNPLRIGAVIFSTEEMPASIPGLGAGDQMLVEHNLPGGGVVLQDFGNKPSEVSWVARFFGPNIEPRVQQLRSYRISGQPQVLSFKKERYLVKIKSFEPGYGAKFNEYKITLAVVQDLNGAFSVPSSTGGSGVSVDSQVAALQAQFVSANSTIVNIDPVGSATFQQSLTNLQGVIAQYTPLAENIVKGSGPILNAVQGALSALSNYQGTLPTGATQLPYVIALQSVLQALGANVQPAQSSTVVSTLGGDLFTYGAMHYGDPSQAFNLAAMNGIINPILSENALTPILLPAAQVS
jgi:hypothetical protein